MSVDAANAVCLIAPDHSGKVGVEKNAAKALAAQISWLNQRRTNEVSTSTATLHILIIDSRNRNDSISVSMRDLDHVQHFNVKPVTIREQDLAAVM